MKQAYDTLERDFCEPEPCKELVCLQRQYDSGEYLVSCAVVSFFAACWEPFSLTRLIYVQEIQSFACCSSRRERFLKERLSKVCVIQGQGSDQTKFKTAVNLIDI